MHEDLQRMIEEKTIEEKIFEVKDLIRVAIEKAREYKIGFAYTDDEGSIKDWLLIRAEEEEVYNDIQSIIWQDKQVTLKEKVNIIVTKHIKGLMNRNEIWFDGRFDVPKEHPLHTILSHSQGTSGDAITQLASSICSSYKWHSCSWSTSEQLEENKKKFLDFIIITRYNREELKFTSIGALDL